MDYCRSVLGEGNLLSSAAAVLDCFSTLSVEKIVEDSSPYHKNATDSLLPIAMLAPPVLGCVSSIET